MCRRANKALFSFVVIGSFLLGCNPRNNVFDFDAFLQGKITTDIEVEGLQADSLFEYQFRYPSSETNLLVFLTNGTCSYCIGTAMSCYRAYCQSDQNASLLFLLQGDDVETFKYYYNKEQRKNKRHSSRKNISMQRIDVLQDLPNGLYFVKNGVVLNYYLWQDL